MDIVLITEYFLYGVSRLRDSKALITREIHDGKNCKKLEKIWPKITFHVFLYKTLHMDTVENRLELEYVLLKSDTRCRDTITILILFDCGVLNLNKQISPSTFNISRSNKSHLKEVDFSCKNYKVPFDFIWL